jgi:hypothetical protein
MMTKSTRFETGGPWVKDPQGVKKPDGFGSIVISLGSHPNDELAESLKGKVPEVYLIGDASKPREVMDAAFERGEVGFKI